MILVLAKKHENCKTFNFSVTESVTHPFTDLCWVIIVPKFRSFLTLILKVFVTFHYPLADLIGTKIKAGDEKWENK